MAAPTLPKKAVKLVHAAVDQLFDRIAHRFLGKPSTDKRILFGWKPRASLPTLFVEASALEGVKADVGTLKRLLDSATNYLEAQRLVTKSRVVKAVESWLHRAYQEGVETDVQTVLGGELAHEFGRAKEAVQLILDTEGTNMRNIGTLDGITSQAAYQGVQDPVVYFIVVNDESLCGECRRLHLMPDGVTPRLWRMSELGHGYHKKGNGTPCVGGLHPRCRCTLVMLQPGYGFDAQGRVEYRSQDHDAYLVQESKSKKSDLEGLAKMSRPEGIETLEKLRELYRQNGERDREVVTTIAGETKPVLPEHHQMVQGSRLTINFPPKVARNLKNTGRFLNQYETGTSMGSYDPKGSRTTFEAATLGIPRDTHYHKRPLYGAVAYLPGHLKVGGASTYGDSFALLKPHVHQRTTVTPQDSFDARADQVYLHDHLPSALPLTDSRWGYIEAQIHGGVDLQHDVESLHLSPDARPEDVEPMVQLGKQYGLPVYHHQIPHIPKDARAYAWTHVRNHPDSVVTHQLYDPTAPPAPAPEPAPRRPPAEQLRLPGVQKSLGSGTSASRPRGTSPLRARTPRGTGNPGGR